MAKGLALLVGLKSVDPNQYNGWNGENGCWGCELDVDNMERILAAQGFKTKVLKTAEATHSNVLQELRSAASSLSAEDILVFYYSGHGGQQPDFQSPTKDERDGQDETLVAYDRQIIAHRWAAGREAVGWVKRCPTFAQNLSNQAKSETQRTHTPLLLGSARLKTNQLCCQNPARSTQPTNKAIAVGWVKRCPTFFQNLSHQAKSKTQRIHLWCWVPLV